MRDKKNIRDKNIMWKLAFTEGFYLGAWKSIPRKMMNNYPFFGNKILSGKFGGSFAPSETVLTRTCENIKLQIRTIDEIIKSDLSTFEIFGNLRDCLDCVVGDIEAVLQLMQEKDDPADGYGM